MHPSASALRDGARSAVSEALFGAPPGGAISVCRKSRTTRESGLGCRKPAVGREQLFSVLDLRVAKQPAVI